MLLLLLTALPVELPRLLLLLRSPSQASIDPPPIFARPPRPGAAAAAAAVGAVNAAVAVESAVPLFEDTAAATTTPRMSSGPCCDAPRKPRENNKLQQSACAPATSKLAAPKAP